MTKSKTPIWDKTLKLLEAKVSGEPKYTIAQIARKREVSTWQIYRLCKTYRYNHKKRCFRKR